LLLEVNMRNRGKALMAGALLLALAAVWSWRSTAEAQPKAKAAPAGLVKRGEYLVNEVARCGDCHTPRDARGKLDMTRHLQGAPMWFKPTNRAGEFEDKAPDITMSGKTGKWNEDKMIKFLSTGAKSDPPMPAYKLTVEDARAMTAYLRSLPGKKGGARRNDD
jgi:mono/diheme cytochrome c family protein